jgi:peptide deformylase
MTGVLTPFPPLYAQIVDPTRYGKYAVTVQTILRFPDHHFRATAQRIVVFDEDLCSLATDLLDTLRAASAIGITATHIGVLKRLAVIELAAAEGVRTYVNPQIVWASADMIRHEEGSVSMPGITEEIERHARVPGNRENTGNFPKKWLQRTESKGIYLSKISSLFD